MFLPSFRLLGSKSVRSILPTCRSVIRAPSSNIKSSSSEIFQKNLDWLDIYKQLLPSGSSHKFSTSLEIQKFDFKAASAVTDSLFYHQVHGPLPVPAAVTSTVSTESNSIKSNRNADIIKLLRDNEVQVLDNTVPLVRPEEVMKAIKVLQKEKVLINGVTLWKREADIFFEMYWKKGLHLDNAIREMKSKSKSKSSSSCISHIVNFCAQKSIDFASKMSKDPEMHHIEYFGILLPPF